MGKKDKKNNQQCNSCLSLNVCVYEHTNHITVSILQLILMSTKENTYRELEWDTEEMIKIATANWTC